jgi:dihydroorotase
MSELLIRGGRVLDPANGVDATLDVLITDGRIARVGAALASDAPVFDATGLVVAPGFVDLHTHLREPGEEHKETIATGTAAAARGGFTTICAMPNTQPTMDSAAVLARVVDASRGAPVRVLPIGAITVGRQGAQLAELADLAAAGAVAFSDDGNGVTDSAVARRAFEYASDLGLPIAEHCEDPDLAAGGVMHEGAVATRLGLRGQPSLAEVTMLRRDIALAELSNARLHICHISTEDSCRAVADAKARGVALSAEVAPHHLLLTDSAVGATPPDGTRGAGYDTNAKVYPPLRSASDVAACIEALAAGVIDAVATDHAPHALPDKQCEFDVAAFGISGLETAFGVLGTLAARNALPLEIAIARLTIGPVRAWGLDRDDLRGLGTLSDGAPGDLAIVDPAAVWTVDPERFASKGKNTPLSGMELTGRVVATVSGGRIVHEERD